MALAAVGSEPAFVFPGQGTQRVGMGAWLFRTAAGREVATEVSDAVGFDVERMCKYGPEAELRRTSYAQPAIFATNEAAYAVLHGEGFTAAAFAGHSVGELNALVATGVLERSVAAAAIAARGRLLEELGRSGEMLAVGGTDLDTVERLCATACSSHDDVAVVAVVNGPRDMVLSGTADALTRVAEAVRPVAGVWAKRVRTSHGFHSPLMIGALEPWRALLRTLAFRPPTGVLVLNRDGRPCADPDSIREATAGQVVDRVRWDLVLDGLVRLGIGFLVEVGDSRVLASIARRVATGTDTVSLHTPAALDKLRAALEPA